MLRAFPFIPSLPDFEATARYIVQQRIVRARKNMVASKPKVMASKLNAERQSSFNHWHLKNVVAVNMAAHTSIQNPVRKN
jgi:hypothetical protein